MGSYLSRAHGLGLLASRLASAMCQDLCWECRNQWHAIPVFTGLTLQLERYMRKQAWGLYCCNLCEPLHKLGAQFKIWLPKSILSWLAISLRPLSWGPPKPLELYSNPGDILSVNRISSFHCQVRRAASQRASTAVACCGFSQLTIPCRIHKLLSSTPQAPARKQCGPRLSLQAFILMD